MKKQLATLLGSSLVVASALSFSTVEVQARPNRPGNDPVLCDAANAGIAGFTSCIGSFDTKLTGNDVLGDGRGPLFDMLTNSAFGGITDWTFAGKQNAGEATATGGQGDLGFQWTEASEGQGTWSLAGAAEHLYADVVISLKSATSWSAYYIAKGTELSSFQNMSWNTLGVDLAGNGKNGKGLSHASIFYANLETQTPVNEQPPVEQPPVNEQPPVEQPPVNEQPPVEQPPVNEQPPVEQPPVN
ncbi:MAG: hypothetical protein SW833_28115, partial [Cyanobacteriota bacterium]|nr:hypothetical protein [Cyanobacteriota bacterium]